MNKEAEQTPEEMLRESERRFRMLLNSGSDAIVVHKVDEKNGLPGAIVEVNDAACRLTEYTREELLSMSPQDLAKSGATEGMSLAIERFKTDRRLVFDSLCRTKTGVCIPVEISLHEFPLSGECMVLSIVRDITERKLTEDVLKVSEVKLQEQKAALEQKNVALREIVEQIQTEKNRIKDDMLANVEDVLLPMLRKLRLKGASRKYVKLLEHHLRNLVSPYARVVTTRRYRLTGREFEICDMIKGGIASKDMAELLGVSYQTVQQHRKNIRRKLGLARKKVNLTSFLRTG